jgi:MFS family permease
MIRSLTDRLKAGVFYGWWMVGSAFGIQVMQSSLLSQSIGAYVAVLQDDMGWSKTALSGAAVIQQVESAILGPIQGWIIDRFGPQWMIRIGMVLFGLGFMLLSQVDTLPGFYGAFMLVALGSGLSGFFPLTVSLVNWFERKRARALSFMQSGYAVGGMAIPIVAWSLQSFGWRATAFASGVLIIVLGVPLATVIRRRPEDHGEVVDGLRDPVAAASASRPAETRRTRDFTAREALRTPAFWFVSLGHGFSLFVVSAVLVHGINHLKEGLGYTIATASLVMSLMTLCQFTGIMVSGFIGDRFDKRFLSAACMFFHMVGLLLLTYAASLPMVLAFAVLHGLSWGMRGPLMQSIRADYFGRSSIGLIIGLSSMIVLVGQVSGPLIAGILADVTGNYRLGFTVLALLSGVGSVFFLLARKPGEPH